MPHDPIVRMDKSTTKVRIVFDCSDKCNGISLNDVIQSGPKLPRELVGEGRHACDEIGFQFKKGLSNHTVGRPRYGSEH